ncbi:MAG: rhomboid family intramembrane serine protease [Bacteroidales bacterium]|nr:rhomboid family intramembrane serine protease [Bacteroidales bacterium]
MSITFFIIILTSSVSIYAFNNRQLFDKFKLNPYMVVNRKEYNRIYTHALLHADWGHLIFNMLTLYFFGGMVEKYFIMIFPAGKLMYALLYAVGILISALPTVLKHKNNHYYNSVGASGAVSAVLFAGILFDPHMSIFIMFIPIPIPAFLFGIAYLVYSQYMSRQNRDNINHDAHFYGAVFGFTFPIFLKPALIGYFFTMLF